MIGKTFAHYEITELLGKGGMGEVYLATDRRLDRRVAIKVLPPEFAGDPDLLQRFEREARAVSGLNHPNICTLHDVGEHEGARFLVMEHIEGETLATRLERGPLPLDEALTVAIQIADALDKAHGAGVLHRDLKPGNIMLAAGGAKLLDFGLAKTGGVGAGPMSSIALTQSSPLTTDGTIIGTFQYMSPEQLEGKPADTRGDVFSFGAVLYEMVTGRRVFEASSQASLIVAIMSGETPRPSAVTPTAPAALDRIVQRCLAKKPEDRWQSAADLAAELRWIAKGGPEFAPGPSGSASTFPRERLAWLAAVVILGCVIAFLLTSRDEPTPVTVTQSTLMPPEDWDFSPRSPFAVSPDGRRIAYVADPRHDAASGATEPALWVRDLTEIRPRLLDGTEGAGYPFWSPDGRWLGFFARGKLNKIEARGGPVIPLCDTNSGRGGTWNEAGTIVFQRVWSEGLMKVSSGGGEPEPVTTLDTSRFDVAHRWPRFLPDGRRFLFYLVSTTSTVTSEHSGVYVGSLDSDDVRLVLKSESRALYSQGHLLYRRGSTLMAQPFDTQSASLLADPIPVATDIPGGALSWGGAHFGVSDGGVLIHMRGANATNSILKWRDRDGNELGTLGKEDGYWDPTLSHDGTRVAVSIGQDTGDIWIHDVERGVRTRFTFDPADDRGPQWSPNDSQIAFASARQSVGEIWTRPASGQGEAVLRHTSGTNITLSDWSGDGRVILFSSLTAGAQSWDMWMLDMDTYEAAPILEGRYSEEGGRLSPDGRWLAFASDASGRDEVYVQAFPEPSGRWMVSTDGGRVPAWSADGRELFYRDADLLMVVRVAGDSTLTFGTPERLLVTESKGSTAPEYAVTRDGQRILTNERLPVDPKNVGASLIQNWTALLDR